MIKKLMLMMVASVSVSSFAEIEFYECKLPQPGKEATVFQFAYDEAQKGLLQGDGGYLFKWPYGHVPHKCGVTSVFDLTSKGKTEYLGLHTSASQFTCQLLTASQEGISISTIAFMFDRKSLTLAMAVYSDVHINSQVKDKYITASVSEPRRFVCEKRDESMLAPEGAGADDEGEAAP